jgi:hypothetical protein
MSGKVNVETSFLQDRSPMPMSSPSKLESGIKSASIFASGETRQANIFAGGTQCRAEPYGPRRPCSLAALPQSTCVSAGTDGPVPCPRSCPIYARSANQRKGLHAAKRQTLLISPLSPSYIWIGCQNTACRLLGVKTQPAYLSSARDHILSATRHRPREWANLLETGLVSILSIISRKRIRSPFALFSDQYYIVAGRAGLRSEQ